MQLGFGLSLTSFRRAGAAMNLVLRASRVSGVAPLGIVFDVVSSTHPDTSLDLFHDFTYFFDFGDGSSEVYSDGLLAGKTTNKYLGGPVVSHVYTQPGTTSTPRVWALHPNGVTLYGPANLSVSGATDAATGSGVITVQDPDIVYAGALTICVSSSGTFTGAPSGAQQVTKSDFKSVMDNEFSASTNKRVLFRGGETFTFGGSTLKGGATRNICIGSFGGGKAIFKPTASGLTMIGGTANAGNPANNMDNWNLSNFQCDANGFPLTHWFASGVIPDTSGDVGVKTYTKGNSTLYDIQTRDGDGIGNLIGFGMVAHRIDCQKINGGAVVNGYIGAYQYGIANGIGDSRFDPEHGGEHCIRTHSERSCVISTYTARPAATKHYITHRGIQVATQTNGVKTRWMNTEYNILDGSLSTTQTDYVTTIAPTNTSSNEMIENVRFNNNYGKALQGQQVAATAARYVSWRNNIIEIASGSVAVTIVSVGNPNGQMTTPTGDFKVDNNTARFANTANSAFVNFQSTTVGSFVRNNVAYAPGQASPLFIQSGSTGVSPTYANNSSNAQMKSTDPLFVGVVGTYANSKLQAGSPYVDTCPAIYRVDGAGYLRQGATVDGGGLNNVNKQTDAWTLVP